MSQGILPRASYHLGQLTKCFLQPPTKDPKKKTLITRVGPTQLHYSFVIYLPHLSNHDCLYNKKNDVCLSMSFEPSSS
jgi:hypothetical protein